MLKKPQQLQMHHTNKVIWFQRKIVKGNLRCTKEKEECDDCHNKLTFQRHRRTYFTKPMKPSTSKDSPHYKVICRKTWDNIRKNYAFGNRATAASSQRVNLPQSASGLALYSMWRGSSLGNCPMSVTPKTFCKN